MPTIHLQTRVGTNAYAPCLAVVMLSMVSMAQAEDFDNPDQPVMIRGHVVDENDRPVAGAEVWCGAPAMGATLWWAQSETSRVRSGDDGQFEVTLPFGDLLYSVNVQRMGYGAPWTQFVASPGKTKEPLKLRMRRGPHWKLQGHLVDSVLKPVADLSLTLVGEYGFSSNTKTDRTGVFHFDDVPEYIGQAVVVAHAAGRAIPQGIVRKGDLKPNELELTLTSTGRFKGQVIDKDTGDAIKGAGVAIRPWFSSGFSMMAKSDSKGQFVIDEVPPGSYLVEPSTAMHFNKPPRGMSHERERIEIKADETVSKVVEMQRRAVVRGQVQDREGHPVAGAIVGMPCTWDGDYRNQVRYVRTNSDGNFEIATGHVEEEELHLSAFSARLGGADLLLTPLAVGEIRGDLVLSLYGAARVRGRVIDTRDRPIASVMCAIGPQEVSDETDADGRFDLGLIALLKDSRPQPALALRAPRPSSVSWISSTYGSKVVPDAPAYYQDATLPFDAKPGDKLDLKATLEPTDLLILKGRVIDAKGRPVPEAKLCLFSGNAGGDTWADHAFPRLRGEALKRPAVENRMLADATADQDGQFRLRTIRFDGEPTTAGTRYSIGVVLGNRGVKLDGDIILPKGHDERELAIQLTD